MYRLQWRRPGCLALVFYAGIAFAVAAYAYTAFSLQGWPAQAWWFVLGGLAVLIGLWREAPHPHHSDAGADLSALRCGYEPAVQGVSGLRASEAIVTLTQRAERWLELTLVGVGRACSRRGPTMALLPGNRWELRVGLRWGVREPGLRDWRLARSVAAALVPADPVRGLASRGCLVVGLVLLAVGWPPFTVLADRVVGLAGVVSQIDRALGGGADLAAVVMLAAAVALSAAVDRDHALDCDAIAASWGYPLDGDVVSGLLRRERRNPLLWLARRLAWYSPAVRRAAARDRRESVDLWLEVVAGSPRLPRTLIRIKQATTAVQGAGLLLLVMAVSAVAVAVAAGSQPPVSGLVAAVVGGVMMLVAGTVLGQIATAAVAHRARTRPPRAALLSA